MRADFANDAGTLDLNHGRLQLIKHHHSTSDQHTHTRPQGPAPARAVLLQSIKDLYLDSGPQWAAAIAYYSLLSMFPLLLLSVSVAAFITEASWASEKIASLLGSYLPQGGNQIEEIVQQTYAARNGLGILSLISLLWSGSRVFAAITKALNIAFDVDETYGLAKRTLIAIAMLVTLGLVFVTALVLPFVVKVLSSVPDLPPGSRAPLLQAARFVGPPILLLVGLLLTYRYVPRARCHWRSAAAGATVAAVLVIAGQPLFFGYIHGIANYNLLYGSLAFVIVLVLWTWIVALIILLGGEIASHTEAMVVDRRSAAEVERRHRARSPVHTVARRVSS